MRRARRDIGLDIAILTSFRFTIDGMTLDELDTTVQDLRSARDHDVFTTKLKQIVTAVGTFQDEPPPDLTGHSIARLRELVDDTVEAIERRIDAGVDRRRTQQHLAGTVYELRRRMEAVEAMLRRRGRV